MVEVLDAGVVREPRTVPTAPSRRGPAQARAVDRQRGTYPGIETTVGWSLLRDSTLGDFSDLAVFLGGPSVNDTSALGVFVALTDNVNPWFGVTVDIGVNFFSQDLVGIDIFDFKILTLLAGPKFTYRQVDRVAPFGQFLIGAAYQYVSIPLADVVESELDFALQPGGGVDVALTDGVALRFGVDARILFGEAGNTANQFRFTTGITFRSNFK